VLHHGFEARARECPEHAALRFGETTLSYGELDNAARRIAASLRLTGLEVGSVVAISISASFLQVAAVLGVMKAGFVYLPATPELPRERRLLYCRQAGARLVLYDPADGQADLGEAGIESLPVTLDTTASAPAHPGEEDARRSPDDLAYVIFTSGSTGTPKGVMITHAACFNTIADIVARTGMNRHSTVLGLSSLNFDLSVFDIFGTLAAGGTLVLMPPAQSRDPAAWLRTIVAAKVTVWNSVPQLMALLIDATTVPEVALASLRSILLSGDWIPLPLTRRLRAALPSVQILSLGGATEASIWSICYPIDQVDDAWRSVPYGRALSNQTCTVITDDGRRAETGEIGTIHIGGKGVALGYIGDPDLTAASFAPPPPALAAIGPRLYCTGDLGRYMADGNIEFLGRRDQQVKVNGNRIELNEIKHVIEGHPSVRNAAVGITDSSAGDRIIVARFQAMPGTPGDMGTALKRWLADRLPAYMVPTFCIQADQLPLSENGKADVQRLLEKPAPTLPVPPAGRPGNGLITLKICQAWSEFMEGILVAPDDDFFGLGGYSLLAFRICNYLRSHWNIDLAPAEMMRLATPAAIAAAIADSPHTTVGTPTRTRQPTTAMAVKSSAYRYPVSKQHEQVWLLSQMRPDNIAYQFQAEIVFSAGLDKAALLAAMRLLTRRHEGLRTWFDFDTAAEAVVEAELEPHIEERSLRNLAIADARLEMRRDIEAFVCRAVSVDRPPLVLWRLFDLPDGTTTLVHLEHHLVHDGWTFRLFLRELSKTYTDLVLGRAVEMHPAPGYSEYASAQQRWLTSPDADAMRLWWRDALQGISPFLALPNRRPDSEFRMRGEIHECSSSAAQFETFRRIARTHGCSVFQFMFAAYAATLAQISGATAFVVGTSTANRTSSEAEEVIGMYVNMMPIPVRLAEGERFRDFMQHLARTVREALSAGALPFTEIVGTVKPQRVAGELPLMQVCFNFHDAFSDALDLPGVTAEVSEAIPNHAAKFELNLTVIPLAEERGGARLLFEYSTDQYAREDVVAFATEYQAMLDRFVRHPEDILRTGSTGLCADGGDDGALLQASTPTLKDVERAVASCAGVASALVIRESDAGDGDGRLAAYVSPIDLSHPPTSQDIAAQLRHRLPEASMPVRIIITSDASWDRSGRTDWKKLMATGIAADVERLPEAVALSAEQTILSVFADLLEGDVDPEDSFFERGGHSLLAARACTRINAVLGSRVGLRDILQWQSARELANLVTQGVTPPATHEPSAGVQ
jgi:amino acid adenylation domain-containing protein